MTALTSIISGGGGGGASAPLQYILNGSQTWIAPLDGNICIHAVGAGGGRSGSQGSGGGGGGYSRKNTFAVTAGDSFTVTIGAGTTSNGGASSFTGTGIGLTSNGGTGSSPNVSQILGGNGSGGDVSFPGQSGAGNAGGAVRVHANSFALTGQTDAQGGGLAASTPGSISGGTVGLIQQNGYSSTMGGAVTNGGDLCGGGSSSTYQGPNGWQSYNGANGGVGGGAGGSYNNRGYVGSNIGGNGVVVIQYLPA